MRNLLVRVLEDADPAGLVARADPDGAAEQQLVALARMVVSELVGAGAGRRAAVLEFAARPAGADALADRLRAVRGDRPFEVDWAWWIELSPNLRLHGHHGKVLDLEFARLDGRPVLVSAGSDGTVRVWDLATGMPVGGPLTGHQGPVVCVAVVELDGRPVVVSGGADRSVRLWDLATRRLIGSPLTGQHATVAGVHVVELAGRLVLIAHSEGVTEVDWPDYDNGLCWLGRPDEPTDEERVPRYRLWDLSEVTSTGTARWVAEVGGHTHAGPDGGFVIAVMAHQDRPVLITSNIYEVSLRKAIGGIEPGQPWYEVWDLLAERPAEATFTEVILGSEAIRVHGRQSFILTTKPQRVLVLDVATGEPLSSPLDEDVGVGEVPGGPAVAHIDRDTERLTMRSVADRRPIGSPVRMHRSDQHDHVCSRVTEVAGRPVVLTAGYTGEIRVWSPTEDSPFPAPPDPPGRIRAIACVRLDGRLVVLSSHEEAPRGGRGIVHRRDTATGLALGDALHAGWVVVAVDDPTSSLMVCGDGTWMQLHDVRTGQALGEPVRVQECNRSRVCRPAVTTTSDGRLVLVAPGDENTVRIWDLVTADPVGSVLAGHTEPVTVVTVAHVDGRSIVVSGSLDETLRVWDLATGEPIGAPISGHSDWISGLATTVLDGRPVIVSGSADGTLRTWDLATATAFGNPATHATGLEALALVAPGGRPAVATGGFRSSDLALWDLNTGRHRTTIPCDAVIRDLARIDDETLAVGTEAGLAVVRLRPDSLPAPDDSW